MSSSTDWFVCIPMAGLIIDAFGELREKEDALTDQLKVSQHDVGRVRKYFSNICLWYTRIASLL